ncbi:hypothetical protein HJC23_002905 [Cyclotella cryptica]|uniref:G-protein coupled receptors family 2 profile 2 domain-containing protein n=1 Tax=Cyclotella cryptica TaxID=29204 RepID=A0ABD3PRD3_9STRA|eukprot:CCRYP_012421-RA/>CCRYP_012421-RA protein AED:0.54 eAED:0.43 QI:0/-1/0/1/-1/1/1/0/388
MRELQIDVYVNAVEVNDSDRTLFVKLILWTTANGISMISTWALIIAIARSPKARRVPFNLYLVFSILPDAYKNTAGFAANLANLLTANGSPNACTVIGWNDAYWWCANFWMACVVFVHLHELLLAVKNAKRHEPPKISRVIKESLTVHTFSAAIASLTLIPVSWIPKATGLSGCEAYPQHGNSGQYIFYWAFFMPATAFVPTLCVTAFCIDVWWRNLLPVNGKTRSLLFYFARLLSVIYIVAIAVIVSFLFGGWVQAVAFAVFNLIGFFSVCLSLIKKDIMKAWNQMWRCQSPNGEVGPNDHSGAQMGPVDETVPRLNRDVRICPSTFPLFFVDNITRSIQSVRNLAMSLPLHYHVGNDDSTKNNGCVVRFQDDTLMNVDVGHAENNV